MPPLKRRQGEEYKRMQQQKDRENAERKAMDEAINATNEERSGGIQNRDTQEDNQVTKRDGEEEDDSKNEKNGEDGEDGEDGEKQEINEPNTMDSKRKFKLGEIVECKLESWPQY